MARKTAVLAVLATALSALTLTHVTPAVAADPVPPFIGADANWLTTTNYYRAMAGLGPVVENANLSGGAYNHSCYMLYNGITHDETPGKAGYTASGDTAGNNGNVAVSTSYGASVRSHIELWMTGPFHAIGILRYNLASVGFGKCDQSSTATGWHSGATMDIISGLGSGRRPSTPILFPGNGTTTNLSTFVTESPNPLDFCSGWSGTAGLPVIAMMPEPVTSASATISGNTGALQTCRLFSGNTSGTASQILAYDNAVTVIPRNALSPGLYTVTITTQARTVRWSFTVDPTAATGVMPVPSVEPAGPASAYTPVSPYRFGDSRINQRITKLLAKTIKKVKVTGTVNMPTDATAISANITVVGPAGPGFVTVYNCSSPMPVASSMNFLTSEIVSNAGIFPLSADGSICFYSPVDTDLIVDINGYFRADSASSYNALTPTPLINTTTRLNATGRMSEGQTISVDLNDAGVGVPDGATAVAVIITGLYPGANSFMTAYPCGGTLPVVSNVNPMVAVIRSNFAIVPLNTAGQLCVYALKAVDLKVDVLGYFTAGGTGSIVPTTPTRVTDTRDVFRTEMNLGTGGMALAAGYTYRLVLGGQRGIPASAKAVSLNVASVFPTGGGSLRISACGTTPNVASLNFELNRVVPSGMQVALSSNGEICIYSTAATHIIIDVTGYWR